MIMLPECYFYQQVVDLFHEGILVAFEECARGWQLLRFQHKCAVASFYVVVLVFYGSVNHCTSHHLMVPIPA